MKRERSLVEDSLHLEGRYGGFCFGGRMPEGVWALNPLPAGTAFPNGARSAILLTFDVEGTYGNGVGDLRCEIDNYFRICERLHANGIPATFNVVGQMAEEQGPAFVEAMWDSGCEVASHGYVHDLNKVHGGDRVYAGHYGPEENLRQVLDGVAALDAIRPGRVRGFRLPYGHFNEYSYDAFEQAGLAWSSNVGIDDFIAPGNGFGPAPFQMKLGDKAYPIVEIPLDSQTYDWSIWMADEQANAPFVEGVRRFCASRGIAFDRSPRGAIDVWRRRIDDALESQTCFTLLCHPINLVAPSDRWDDACGDFLLPVIDLLGDLHRAHRAWVCTCGDLADVYWAKQGRAAR